MIKIDNKEFNNLIEQVRQNQLAIATLSQGLDIVGTGEAVPEDLPNGKAYLKIEGDQKELFLKINNTLVNLGEFPARGPQGIQGAKGDAASIGTVSASASTLEPGSVASASVEKDGANLLFFFNIPKGQTGTMGPSGPTGPAGPTGPQGPQGPQGDPAFAIRIIGTVTASTDLPIPSSVARGDAYLVGASDPYELYVLVGTTTLSWFNAGAFTSSVVVVDAALDKTSTNAIQNKPVALRVLPLEDYLNVSDYTQPGNTLESDIVSVINASTKIFFKGEYDGSTGVGYADEAASIKTSFGVSLEAGKTVDGHLDEPFGFRATAHPFNQDIITIGGQRATVNVARAYGFVKNNKLSNGNFSDSSEWSSTGGTWTQSSNVATVTSINDDDPLGLLQPSDNLIGGHVYLFLGQVKASKSLSGKGGLYFGSQLIGRPALNLSESWQFFALINYTVGSETQNFGFVVSSGSGILSGDSISLKDFSIVDLTQWFNNDSSILAKKTETWFSSWFLNNFALKIPSSFDDGTVEFGWAKTIKTVNENQWDEEWEINSTLFANNIFCSKNPIKVFPNTQYCFVNSIVNISSRGLYIAFYDMNGNLMKTNRLYAGESWNEKAKIFTTPSECGYIKFGLGVAYYGNTYINDIQICLHWSDISIENTYHKHEEWLFDMGWSFAGSDGPAGVNSLCGDEKNFIDKKNKKIIDKIDLGTPNWTYYTSGGVNVFYTDLSRYGMKNKAKILTSLYIATDDKYNSLPDMCISTNNQDFGNSSYVFIKNTSYTSAAAFKAAMAGSILYFEKAASIDSDMEEGEALANSYFCNDYGTEQVLDEDGNQSICSFDLLYENNLVRQIVNNQAAISDLNSKIPSAPNADGVYKLTCTVSGGVASYSWEE